MADVAAWVAQIRAAIYGEQVRESIAKSIEAMNDDNIETKQYYDDTIDDAEAATAAANSAASSATTAGQTAVSTANQAANYATTTADEAAETAVQMATDKCDEVQEKLDRGDFIGATGPKGDAATITVGSVTTGLPGTSVQVTNSGTSANAILNFTIPQGATGNVENLNTATVTFGQDESYQNISTGMTVAGLFSRIARLFDILIVTGDEMDALETILEIE